MADTAADLQSDDSADSWEYTGRFSWLGYRLDRASRTPDPNDFIVSVNKIGGGTLGRAYTGAWQVRVVTASVNAEGIREVLLDDELSTWDGKQLTHIQAAEQAVGFVLDDRI